MRLRCPGPAGVLAGLSSERFCVVDNWALIHARRLALEEKVPLHVCVCLHVPKSQLSTLRHYSFLLKGLEEVAAVGGGRRVRPASASAQTFTGPPSHRNAKPWASSSTCSAAPRGTSFRASSRSSSWGPW